MSRVGELSGGIHSCMREFKQKEIRDIPGARNRELPPIAVRLVGRAGFRHDRPGLQGDQINEAPTEKVQRLKAQLWNPAGKGSQAFLFSNWWVPPRGPGKTGDLNFP